jgi:hypothetical protein
MMLDILQPFGCFVMFTTRRELAADYTKLFLNIRNFFHFPLPPMHLVPWLFVMCSGFYASDSQLGNRMFRSFLCSLEKNAMITSVKHPGRFHFVLKSPLTVTISFCAV